MLAFVAALLVLPLPDADAARLDALALVAITSSSLPDWPEVEENSEELRAALERQGRRLGLIGDGCCLCQEMQWAIGSLQMAYQAPPLSDLDRWPDRATVTAQRHASREFRELLRCRLLIEPDNQALSEILTEAEKLYAIWDKLDDVQSPTKDLTNRLVCLYVFRSLLGEENYLAGRIPPALPLHRFRQID